LENGKIEHALKEDFFVFCSWCSSWSLLKRRERKRERKKARKKNKQNKKWKTSRREGGPYNRCYVEASPERLYMEASTLLVIASIQRQ